MTSNAEKPSLAVAQLRSYASNEDFFRRHLPLAKEIADRGASLVAINGKKDHTTGNFFSKSYTFDESVSDLVLSDQPIAIEAAFDLSGGVARYIPEVAALNPGGVRDIVVSKSDQYETLKSLEGHIPLTIPVPAQAEAIRNALELFSSPKIIMKADSDPAKKKPMLIGTKDYVVANLEAFLSSLNPTKDIVLLQEYMEEVNAEFSSGIEFADVTERELAESRKHLNRELRVTLVDDRPILVTGRVGLSAAEGSPMDKWVHLNQESIPGHVTELASRVARQIMARAQALDAYLAVDLTPEGSKIIEVNGRNIGTMSIDETRPASQYAHRVTTGEIAGKLISMAENKRQEVQS